MRTRTTSLEILEDGLLDEIEDQADLPERVLLWLLKHPFQRSEDLALALGVHRTSIVRTLQVQREQGLVEQVRPAACPSFAYLTTAGIHVMAKRLGAVPEVLARLWQADETALVQMLPRLSLRVPLQNSLNGLMRQTPTVFADTDGLPTRIRWHWLQNYPDRHLSTWICDAALVFSRQPLSRERDPGKIQEQGWREYYCALLLVDPGLVGPMDLHQMDTCLHRGQRVQADVQQQTTQGVPPLLILTSSQRQRELWQWRAREHVVQHPDAPLFGAVVTHPFEQPIRSTWALSWHRLVPSGPCRLRDLFVPLPRAALPQGLLAPRPLPEGLFGPAQRKSPHAIVRGQFAARATTRDPTTSERRTIACASLSLYPGDWKLLLDLYAFPLAPKPLLAVQRSLSLSSLTRVLYDLRRQGWLVGQAGGAEKGWHLSTRGLQLLAQRLHVPLTQVAEHRTQNLIQQGCPQTTNALAHQMALAQIFTHISHTAAATPGHQLLWWEAGPRCLRRVQIQGRWYTVSPDGSLCYQAGEQVIRAWIDWYPQGSTGRSLRGSLSQYAHFVSSRAWAHEAQLLPLFLIIVADVGQEQRIHRLAPALLGKTDMVVRCTTMSRLEQHGPLGEIWLPILPVPQQNTSDEFPARLTWQELPLREAPSRSHQMHNSHGLKRKEGERHVRH